LFITLIALTGINVPIYFFLPDNEGIQVGFLIVSILFYLLVLNFFRSPERVTEINDNHIIAPADGKVVAIEEVEEKEYFNDKRIQVSIFMSPFDVHNNRTPISGKVVYAKYHPGAYLMAFNPKSSNLNEHNSLVVENPHNELRILMRQIAGFIARRVVCYVKEGDQVEQGKEVGFIKFGSRVDLLIPTNAELKVELKQQVKGGESLIAAIA